MTSVVIEPPTPRTPHKATLQRLVIPRAARVGAAASSAASSGAGVRDDRREGEGGGERQDGQGREGFWYCPNFISEEEERYLLAKIYAAPLPKWKSLHARRLQHWGGQLSSSSGSASSSSSAASSSLASAASSAAQADAAAAAGAKKASLPTLIPGPMPDWYERHPYLKQRLVDIGAFEGSPHGVGNSVLVNEYLPGQGIMPHEDGGAYYPAVATISLGSHTLLDIYRYVAEEPEPEPGVAAPPASSAASHAAAAPASDAPNGAQAPPSQGPMDAEAHDANSSPSLAATNTQTQAQAQASGSRFRAREQLPAFSILQEPRSLLLTRGDAYTSYMHGIAERAVDSREDFARVINAALVEAPKLRDALVSAGVASRAGPSGGGTITEEEEKEEEGEGEGQGNSDFEVKREKRVSITVRDVPRVAKGLAGLLRRK